MSDELQRSNEPIEEGPGSSMTLKTTLDDGTTINLTVSPIPTASSAVTASTTFTHTSFSFQISTSLPSQVLPSRKVSPSPEAHCCPLKTTKANPPSDNHSKPRNMPSHDLPNDVVGIDSGNKTRLFYVYQNPKGTYYLSYLESLNASGKGNYKVEKINRAQDLKETNVKKQWVDIEVSPRNTQVAAVTWNGSQGPEIRVYYVDNKTDHLQEVCKTGDGDWYIGALSYRDGNKYKVRPGTSISASVHAYGNYNFNLRVFAAEDGEVNMKGLPQISAFNFLHDETGDSSWQGGYITSAITEY